MIAVLVLFNRSLHCDRGEGGGGVRKHTRLRSPDEMELMELRLFAAAPLTPRGVLSEDMVFFFQGILFVFWVLDMWLEGCL